MRTPRPRGPAAAPRPAGASFAVAPPGGGLRAWATGADAVGELVHPGRWAALSCAGKPLIALAVLALARRGDLPLATPLGDVLGGPDVSDDVARTRVGDLLRHGSELGCAGGLANRLMPPPVRRAHCRGLRRSVDAARQPAYVEFETWFLLGEVLEEVSGLDIDEAVAGLVLDPYGVDRADVAVWTGRRAPGWPDRVAVSARDVGDGALCALSEITPGVADEWNPAVGGYAAPRALARVGLGILGDIAGAGRVLDADLAAESTSARARTEWDAGLQRPSAFGYGFMVEVDDLAPSWPPGTFGHTSAGAQVTWLLHADVGAGAAHVLVAAHGVDEVRSQLAAAAAVLAGALA